MTQPQPRKFTPSLAEVLDRADQLPDIRAQWMLGLVQREAEKLGIGQQNEISAPLVTPTVQFENPTDTETAQTGKTVRHDEGAYLELLEDVSDTGVPMQATVSEGPSNDVTFILKF